MPKAEPIPKATVTVMTNPSQTGPVSSDIVSTDNASTANASTANASTANASTDNAMTDITMNITTTSASLLRLLQLSSVSLPVGGFAFSQGLEFAVETGWVRTAEQTEDWLVSQLQESVARVDLPVLQGAMQALAADDLTDWQEWNDIALANRETRELRFTDAAMGQALKRLLGTLSIAMPVSAQQDVSFVSLFAVAAHSWQMAFDLAAYGYLWSWLENQIAAATKLVPLGQTQAQLLLGRIQLVIPEAIALANTLDRDSLGGSLPGLALASSWHETQYTRLFRS